MEYGVDIVLAGHIHAYERTYNVFNASLNPCGPVHLTIGDGGNYDGAASPWRYDRDGSTADKPEWSAFRESSFGVAELLIVNSTHAKYSWHRHACGSDSESTHHINVSSTCSTPGDNGVNAMDTSDDLFIVRPDATVCPNRWRAKLQTNDISQKMNRNAPGRLQGLYVVAILLSCVILFEGLLIWNLYRKSQEGIISYVIIDDSEHKRSQL